MVFGVILSIVKSRRVGICDEVAMAVDLMNAKEIGREGREGREGRREREMFRLNNKHKEILILIPIFVIS